MFLVSASELLFLFLLSPLRSKHLLQ